MQQSPNVVVLYPCFLVRQTGLSGPILSEKLLTTVHVGAKNMDNSANRHQLSDNSINRNKNSVDPSFLKNY